MATELSLASGGAAAGGSPSTTAPTVDFAAIAPNTVSNPRMAAATASPSTITTKGLNTNTANNNNNNNFTVNNKTTGSRSSSEKPSSSTPPRKTGIDDEMRTPPPTPVTSSLTPVSKLLVIRMTTQESLRLSTISNRRKRGRFLVWPTTTTSPNDSMTSAHLGNAKSATVAPLSPATVG
eukprot:CAMPEP_0116556476 /NCGR_PEP_ID=MMETSP0397-20121206/8715_1 /TAXON_ID=216820 /ORGANISM="Cyclophora tenuis, Strain ECT3854" /LENGTH=178 /DNA_ID=CAMNT_0004081845 /DNA_START=178 /DNA_END=714 /DNA_ORIENTATION=-